MTLTWLAVASALILWPLDTDPRRVAQLRIAGRLSGSQHVGRASFTGRLVLPPIPPALAALIGGAAVGLPMTSTLGLIGGIECGLCTAVVLMIALSSAQRAIAGRRDGARLASVVLAVSLVAAELDAGAAPERALAATGSIGDELARALTQPAPLAASQPGDPLDRVVAAWRMSRESGVPLAEILTRVRADLSGVVGARRELATAVAGPRASATLLALLPVIGVGLGAAMGAHPLTVLLHTSAGRLLLCLGLVLDGLGVLWTERLIARALR